MTPPRQGSAEYEYYALISFCQADEIFAQQLAARIEAFELPNHLRVAYPDLPVKLGAIICQPRDFSLEASDESADLREKRLSKVGFLVTLCSAQTDTTNQDNAFNKEIEVFAKAGRLKNVIPVLLEGQGVRPAMPTPSSPAADDTDSKAIAPTVMAEMNADTALHVILASPLDLERSSQKIIARLMGLDPEILWAQEPVETKTPSRLGRFGLPVVVFLTIVTLIAYFYWDHKREKIELFADYVLAYGVPSGLYPLEEMEAARLPGHYRFLFRKGDLLSVTYVDSAGRPKDRPWSEEQPRPAIQEFSYDQESGDVSQAQWYDQYRNLKTTVTFNGSEGRDIAFKVYGLENEALNAWLKARKDSMASGQFFFVDPNAIRSQVRHWELIPDENGFFTNINYRQLDSDQAARNSAGVFGQMVERDEQGRVVRLFYHDAQGQPMDSWDGSAGTLYRYDGPNLAEVTNIDLNGRPVVDNREIIRTLWEYDSSGRMLKESYVDAAGSLKADSKGLAETTWAYNDNGQVIREAYFDAQGQPFRNERGYAGWEQIYGPGTIERRFFGPGGEPTFDRGGAARVRRTLNEKGETISLDHFGLEGLPQLGSEGYARATFSYDQQGRLVGENFFNASGQPTLTKWGYAGVTRAYNDFGSIREESYWGPDGRPILGLDGYASMVVNFDEGGVAEKIIYFGVDGQMRANNLGYAQLFFETDDYGHPLSLTYYGLAGEPVWSVEGFSQVKWNWSDDALLEEVLFFNPDGSPASFDNGISGVRYEYNDEGRLTASFAFGPGGQILSTRRYDETEPYNSPTLPTSESQILLTPERANFGIFYGESEVEVTILNLSGQDILISEPRTTLPYLSFEFPNGRLVPALDSIGLKVKCVPPAEYGGNLQGQVILAAGASKEPPIVIPVVGQYNPGQPIDPREPEIMSTYLITYNPQSLEPFDYSHIVVDGQRTVHFKDDGTWTEEEFSIDGKIIWTKWHRADGTVELHKSYRYDSEGQITDATTHQVNGGTEVYRYENGELIEIFTSHPTGRLERFRPGEHLETH